MPQKTLLDLLREKLTVLISADDVFLESVKGTEDEIFLSTVETLRQFKQNNGRLQSDESSSLLMGKIRKDTKQIIKGSSLPENVDDFLPNFDQVEQLNGEIYGRIVPKGLKLPPVGTAKRNSIEKVVRGLKDLKGIESVLEIPLRNQLFQLVETQTRFTDAVDSLSVLIKGRTGNGGDLSRYARTLATDLLNGFNGYQEQQIARANGLDGFFYTGSLIDTSRDTCIHLSGGIGEYEDLAIRPGLYPVSAIPEIVRRSQGNDGWRPETTADTFAIYRGGFNCRHLLVFVPLTKSERARVEKIQDEISPIKSFDPQQPTVDPEPVVDTNAPGGNRYIWEIEKNLVPLDKEKGFIFNSTDTGILWQKGGARSSIRIDQRAAELMENRIFTHNHPSWKNRPDERGSSFSIDEVVTQGATDQGQQNGDIIIAYRNGLKEMRAVSKKDTFIFRPDISGKHEVGGFISGLESVSQRLEITERNGRKIRKVFHTYDFSKIDEIPEYRKRQFARSIYYQEIVRPKMRTGLEAFEARMAKVNDDIKSLTKQKNELSKEWDDLFDQVLNEKISDEEFDKKGDAILQDVRKLEKEIEQIEQDRQTFWTHWQMEEIAKQIPGDYIHINETRE